MKVPLIILLFNTAWPQLTISEVMFDLDGSDSPHEFVEIYNFSNEDVQIQNWQIADNLSIDDLLMNGFNEIPSNHFAVILESDYDGFFDNYFSEGVLIIYVDDLSIGNGLGNTNDSLFLINDAGLVISSMGWNSGIDPGYSLEKVVLDFANYSYNWRQSLDSLGTPSKPNSVAYMTVDIAIDSVYVLPEIIFPNQNYSIFIRLTNVGILSGITELWINSELIESLEVTPLEDQLLTIPEAGNSSGVYSYLIQTVTADDFNPLNDSLTFLINIQYQFGDVLINEIMYDPETGESEWVELVNRRGIGIQLKNWVLQDKDEWDSEDGIVTNGMVTNEFSVISGDTIEQFLLQPSFPSLNNSSDDIYLFDPTGKLIDHVHYESSWGGGDGFSLERITFFMDSNNPQNWGSCINLSGSTPNEKNSLFVTDIHQSGSIDLSPNPFSPDGDGHEDELVILYQLPYASAYLRMVVFDAAGREVALLANGHAVSNEGVVRWDGKTSRGYTSRMGQYLLLTEAVNRQSGEIWKTVERIIVAKK